MPTLNLTPMQIAHRNKVAELCQGRFMAAKELADKASLTQERADALVVQGKMDYQACVRLICDEHGLGHPADGEGYSFDADAQTLSWADPEPSPTAEALAAEELDKKPEPDLEPPAPHEEDMVLVSEPVDIFEELKQ